MARYSALLGHKVEIHYCTGDVTLPAAGILVADSGRSIFLEQKFDQRGLERTFRWEVPYAYIIQVEDLPPDPVPNEPHFLAVAEARAAAEKALMESPGQEQKASTTTGPAQILPFNPHAKLA